MVSPVFSDSEGRCKNQAIRAAEESRAAMASAVRFVGLDALSLDLASSLFRSGYKVQAFEVSRFPPGLYFARFVFVSILFLCSFSVLLDLDLEVIYFGKVFSISNGD